MRAPTRPWFGGETPIPLQLVPRHLPPSGTGAPRSTQTIYRWTTIGVRGVRLRRFRGGGSGWCTTVQEIERFLSALTVLAGEEV